MSVNNKYEVAVEFTSEGHMIVFAPNEEEAKEIAFKDDGEDIEIEGESRKNCRLSIQGVRRIK